MKLTVKNLTGINKVASEVYEKHVKNVKMYDVLRSDVVKTSGLSKQDIENIICLYIYGVYGTELSKHYDTDVQTISDIRRRLTHRKLDISFQVSKVKRRGKMVFQYDKYKTVKHFNSLPKELKSLSHGFVFDERLVIETKILKSELY